MEGVEYRSCVTEFGCGDNSTTKGVLYALKTVELVTGKADVQRVAEVQFGVDNGGGNCASSFVIKTRTDTAQITDMEKVAFRHRRDLLREGQVLIKDETKICKQRLKEECWYQE